MKDNSRHLFNSISELHSQLKFGKPAHPLVSVIRLDDIDAANSEQVTSIVYNFYAIFLKKNFNGKLKYGQQYYDFDNGTMTFFAPGQSIVVEDYTPSKLEGWALIVHPDFLQGYPLSQKIKNYGLFSYATNEALHVSEKEDNIISGIMQNLQQEIETMIDDFTQDVVVSHIELLLTYCNRFYHRQFITRKTANNTLVAQMETLLADYLNSDQLINQGLPTVQYIAQQLNISPSYLGDMLRYHTGMNTQQHIQTKLIEKAKDLLTSTNLTVAEIAYKLGFEHPQSFNKLFKNKTSQSPLEYRQSFN